MMIRAGWGPDSRLTGKQHLHADSEGLSATYYLQLCTSNCISLSLTVPTERGNVVSEPTGQTMKKGLSTS